MGRIPYRYESAEDSLPSTEDVSESFYPDSGLLCRFSSSPFTDYLADSQLRLDDFLPCDPDRPDLIL